MGLFQQNMPAAQGPGRRDIDMSEAGRAARKASGAIHGVSTLGFPTQEEEDAFVAQARQHPIVQGSRNDDYVRLVFNSRLPSHIVMKETLVLDELRDVTGARTIEQQAVLRKQQDAEVKQRFVEEMKRHTAVDQAADDVRLAAAEAARIAANAARAAAANAAEAAKNKGKSKK